MTRFTVHDETTAPEAARPLLKGIKAKYGLIPNILGVFAENPSVLSAYAALGEFVAKSGLDPLEQQIVQIATSVDNECHFCVAAHSAVGAGSGLDMETIGAVRENRAIANRKHEALRRFTAKVVQERGFVSDADVDAFIEAGYTRSTVLAVILNVAMKTISNYTNHIAETPLNPEFADFAWQPASKAKVA